MRRGGDIPIGAGEQPPEAPRRGHRTRCTSTIAVLAALLAGAGACGHPPPVIYPPMTPATGAGDPASTEVSPEAGQGTATSPASTGIAGTGDAPASTVAGDAPAAMRAHRDDDEHLIASVHRAVAENTPPDDVPAMVGKKPTVNTRAGLSIAVLRRVNLVPDDAHTADRLDLASAEAVMYWARPVDSLDPHFVGIQFRKDGTRSLFFAILLPP